MENKNNPTPNRARMGMGQGMRPGGGGGPLRLSLEKPRDFKGTMKQLLAYIGKYKLGVAVVMVFAVLSTVFTILGPKILSRAITELFNGLVSSFSGGPGIDFDKVGSILLSILFLYVASFIASAIQGWIMTGITQKISYSLRKELTDKIHRMPMNYFEGDSIGNVLSRITNDVDTLGQNLNQSVTQIITSICTVVGVLVMMLTISPIMTLIALAILPISGALIGLVVKLSQKYFRAQQNYLGAINGQVEETIGGQNIVRLFNHEAKSLEEFKSNNDILFQSAWKSQFLSGLMMPMMNFVGNLGYVAVAIIGGLLAFNGTITVGDIQAFIQYVRSFTQPISQLAQISNLLQSMAAAAERVFAFLNEEEEIDSENPIHLPQEIKGEVTFANVKFGYNEDTVVIHDFNSEISAGQMVAIVGPTGAGKTTMVKLLMRFYDVNSGAILIDGANIKEIPRAELRKNIGMVLQDTWLFKGSIMENIRYGRLDASDEEVIKAAKAARANHFIKTLPDGYNMELNEEVSNISQGQKQLLTIARAILADKPIMILDEATSSVDTRTEGLIQDAMNTLMKGRTSFVIAHRLSTIQDADKILVMNHGDIVEQGTHQELLDKKGFYADLYNSQFDQVEE